MSLYYRTLLNICNATNLIDIMNYTIPNTSPIYNEIVQDGVNDIVTKVNPNSPFINKYFKIILQVYPETISLSTKYRIKVYKDGSLVYIFSYTTGNEDFNSTGNVNGYAGQGDYQFYIESATNFKFKIRMKYEMYQDITSGGPLVLVDTQNSPLGDIQTII